MSRAPVVQRYGRGGTLAGVLLLSLISHAHATGQVTLLTDRNTPAVTTQPWADIPDPVTDYPTALAALAAGDPAAAIAPLERVILSQNSFAGAWVDLAVAYAQLGDLDAADALIDAIFQRFAPPEPLAERLRALQRQVRAQRQRGSVWRQRLGVSLGHASNANAGSSANAFLFTPLGLSPLLLKLASDQRPRSDAFTGLSYQAQRQLPQGEGRLRQQLLVERRDYHREREVTLTDVSLGQAWVRPGAQGQERSLGLSLRHVRLGEGALFSSVSLQADELATLWQGTLRNGLAARCDRLLQADLEWREDAREGFDASQLQAVQGGVLCQGGRWQAGVLARLAHDRVQGRRPGGNQHQHDLVLPLRLQLAPAWQLSAQVQRSRVKDQTGYSPLLAFNARRGVTRELWRVQGEWQPPLRLGEVTRLRLSWENLTDVSNLPLFSQKNRVLMVTGQVDF